MITKTLQAKPRVELPDKATVGEVLTLRGPIVNVFSGLYQLHFSKGGDDAPNIVSFDIIDWQTISFIVPNKVGEVAVTSYYAAVSAVPEEIQLSGRITIVPA
ncbi:hypothetical protein [Pseudomonas gingeri]|uniref:hypothetical protein n=1 Tax=Pseudomonas gingeri TaxID=117681 RepID=UPI0015A4A292|nr:hypothetical protein [Pseudomonas gingeri]NWA07186.1 hypothetical protein [Pseudomonas gingeri]